MNNGSFNKPTLRKSRDLQSTKVERTVLRGANFEEGMQTELPRQQKLLLVYKNDHLDERPEALKNKTFDSLEEIDKFIADKKSANRRWFLVKSIEIVEVNGELAYTN